MRHPTGWILITFLCLALPLGSSAYEANSGTFSAPFLKIGAGARATAMGDAQVAVTSDSGSIYWNPAGLAFIEGGDLTFTHNEWLTDTRYEFFSAGYRLGRVGVFGGGASYLSYGDIPGYDNFGNPTGTFTASDMAIYLSYARNLFGGICIGISGKYIQQKIGAEGGDAYAVDLGGIWVSPLVGLSFGASIANIGTELTFVNEGAKLPLIARGGFAYRLPLPAKNVAFLTAFDLVKMSGEEMQYHLGSEITLYDLVSIRLGYKGSTDIEGFSTGVGISHSLGNIGLRVDYSFSSISESEFGDAHRITLGMSF